MHSTRQQRRGKDKLKLIPLYRPNWRLDRSTKKEYVQFVVSVFLDQSTCPYCSSRCSRPHVSPPKRNSRVGFFFFFFFFSSRGFFDPPLLFLLMPSALCCVIYTSLRWIQSKKGKYSTHRVHLRASLPFPLGPSNPHPLLLPAILCFSGSLCKGEWRERERERERELFKKISDVIFRSSSVSVSPLRICVYLHSCACSCVMNMIYLACEFLKADHLLWPLIKMKYVCVVCVCICANVRDRMRHIILFV